MMLRLQRFTFTFLIAVFVGLVFFVEQTQAQTFQCMDTVRVDVAQCNDAVKSLDGSYDCRNGWTVTNPNFVATCTDKVACSTANIFNNGVCSSNDTCTYQPIRTYTTINNVANCGNCLIPADQAACIDVVDASGSFTCLRTETPYCGCSHSFAYCGMSGTLPVPTGGASVGCNSACPVSGCPAPLGCVGGAGPGGQPGCWAAGSCGGGGPGNCPANFNAYFDANGNLVTTFTRGGWNMRYHIWVDELNSSGNYVGLIHDTGGPCDPTIWDTNSFWTNACQPAGWNQSQCGDATCHPSSLNAYPAYNETGLNGSLDGYGAPEATRRFGISRTATSYTMPASYFQGKSTVRVFLDGADGPVGHLPTCDPFVTTLTVPSPPRNACEIQINSNSILTGSNVIIDAHAALSDPSLAKMQVWIEKKDGTQIPNYTSVFGLTYRDPNNNLITTGNIIEAYSATNNKYYYRLSELTCNGSSGTSCSAPTGYVRIENPNDYIFHCDAVPNAGGINAYNCSGNPFCSYESQPISLPATKTDCAATGWASCSGAANAPVSASFDNAAITVQAPACTSLTVVPSSVVLGITPISVAATTVLPASMNSLFYNMNATSGHPATIGASYSETTPTSGTVTISRLAADGLPRTIAVQGSYNGLPVASCNATIAVNCDDTVCMPNTTICSGGLEKCTSTCNNQINTGNTCIGDITVRAKTEDVAACPASSPVGPFSAGTQFQLNSMVPPKNSPTASWTNLSAGIDAVDANANYAYTVNTTPLAGYYTYRHCLYNNSGTNVTSAFSPNRIALVRGDNMTMDVYLTAITSWFQAKGADVYVGSTAIESLRSLLPFVGVDPRKLIIDGTTNGANGSPGVAIYGGSYDLDPDPASPGDALFSSTNWKANESYELSPATDFYSLFYGRYDHVTTTGGMNAADMNPTSPGPALASGAYYLPTSATTNGFVVPSGKSYVIFVNGTMTISGNITLTDNTSFLAIIANGGITVTSAVGLAPGGAYNPNPTPHIQGIFITSGPFTTQDASGKQLVVKGSVVANSFTLGRSLGAGGASNPSEMFLYDPALLLSMPEAMRDAPLKWSEVAP